MVSVADDLWDWEASSVADLGGEDFFEPRAVRPLQEKAKGKWGDLVVEGEAEPGAVVV